MGPTQWNIESTRHRPSKFCWWSRPEIGVRGWGSGKLAPVTEPLKNVGLKRKSKNATQIVYLFQGKWGWLLIEKNGKQNGKISDRKGLNGGRDRRHNLVYFWHKILFFFKNYTKKNGIVEILGFNITYECAKFSQYLKNVYSKMCFLLNSQLNNFLWSKFEHPQSMARGNVFLNKMLPTTYAIFSVTRTKISERMKS